MYLQRNIHCNNYFYLFKMNQNQHKNIKQNNNNRFSDKRNSDKSIIEKVIQENAILDRITIEKPIIGITIGDYNGVAVEVIMKTFADARMLNICTPVIYGSSKILLKYRKPLNLDTFQFVTIKDLEGLQPKKINLISCFETDILVVGEATEEAGNNAFLALECASKDLLRGKLEAVVTAPINKHTITNENWTYAGHTEYFTENFGAKDSLMLLVCDNLRVGVITGHVALADVPKLITKERVESKIKILEKSLKEDFGIKKPRIAILGLNPHAGENGMFGKEEKDIIEPIITTFRKKGMLIYGCFPADGFFGMKKYTEFDGVLAMYHDQGLVPFKTLAFERGINFTAGLPVIRTSPDHGTAYAIAGKNEADETSFREAIYLACDLVKIKKYS